MAFVRCDNSRTWVCQDRLLKCPQVIQVGAATEPYFNVDFGGVLDRDEALTSTVSVVEDGAAFTTADVSISDQATVVSFKPSAALSAGTYQMNVSPLTVNGSTLTYHCVLIVV